MSMISHSGYTPGLPRSRGSVNSGKWVARRKSKKYLRVAFTHCLETMLSVRLSCIVCPFHPGLPPLCHTLSSVGITATPRLLRGVDLGLALDRNRDFLGEHRCRQRHGQF